MRARKRSRDMGELANIAVVIGAIVYMVWAYCYNCSEPDDKQLGE